MISTQIQPYAPHPKAWIISCFFNPTGYGSRRANFDIFYEQLRRSNVNYLIAECAFGKDKFVLPADKNILRFRSKNKLWQKERLLNLLVKQLPAECEYVFWLDADVLFANPDWIVDSVEVLKTNAICQPFSTAVRLEKGESEPSFNVKASTLVVDFPSNTRQPQTRLWRSFAYNYCNNRKLAESPVFDIHGHTGFAWGARRELPDKVPLFDRAIVGTADHIIAHAAVGQIPHNCLEKAFGKNKSLENIYDWSLKFNHETQNKLGFAKGELWHLWHGELKNRQYLERTQEFSDLEFDTDDLEENEDGLWEFPEDRRDVQIWMNGYFESRREDDQIHHPIVSNLASETTSDSEIDAKTDSSETLPPFEGFGGGDAEFRGAGAGGSWENYS